MKTIIAVYETPIITLKILSDIYNSAVNILILPTHDISRKSCRFIWQ
jgi:hypothetical protein